MNINLNKFIYLLIFVSLVILIMYFFKNYYEGFKFRINHGNQKCLSNNCPNPDYQNKIFKIHTEFKPIRDKNHMVAHNSESKVNNTKIKGPNNIFIIRHGEKVKSKTALDCNGILRSSFIPKLIETINEEGIGIHVIITAYDYDSMHQQQTISLVSWLLNIPIFMYGQQTQSINAVKEIFENSNFNGKNILICWEHTCIQTLIKNIIKIGPPSKGLKNYKFLNPENNSKLPYWETNNYNTIFHFDKNLNFSVFEEPFFTCYTMGNNLIQYGKKQICK